MKAEVCERCGAAYPAAGDGWCGLCPSCADKAERGNCYEAAAKLLHAHRDCPGIALAHGTVTGQGPVAGIRYGHAWVEIGEVVLDPSNGRLVVARKTAYYAAGEIAEPVARYTFAEAAREMLETGHYGPWEKRPSPNNPAEPKRSHTLDNAALRGPFPLTKPAGRAPRKMVKKSDGLSAAARERTRA